MEEGRGKIEEREMEDRRWKIKDRRRKEEGIWERELEA
jgi:hypothetical protein